MLKMFHCMLESEAQIRSHCLCVTIPTCQVAYLSFYHQHTSKPQLLSVSQHEECLR